MAKKSWAGPSHLVNIALASFFGRNDVHSDVLAYDKWIHVERNHETECWDGMTVVQLRLFARRHSERPFNDSGETVQTLKISSFVHELSVKKFGYHDGTAAAAAICLHTLLPALFKSV